MSKKQLLDRIVKLEQLFQGKTEFTYAGSGLGGGLGFSCTGSKHTQGALSKIEALQEEVSRLKLDNFQLIEYLGIKKKVTPATPQETKYVKVKKR